MGRFRAEKLQWAKRICANNKRPITSREVAAQHVLTSEIIWRPVRWPAGGADSTCGGLQTSARGFAGGWWTRSDRWRFVRRRHNRPQHLNRAGSRVRHVICNSMSQTHTAAAPVCHRHGSSTSMSHTQTHGRKELSSSTLPTIRNHK